MKPIAITPEGFAQLPLAKKPSIHQAGVGIHGRKREERFLRPKLWAVHLYFWTGSVSFAGQSFAIEPHCLGLTPPDTELTWRFPDKTCPHRFIHFELPGSDEIALVPAMQMLGKQFTRVDARFEGIIDNWPSQRTRAEAALWDMLWELEVRTVDTKKPPSPPAAGAIETALGIIENELGANLNAKVLAHRIGISYSQLNRLFQQHLHTSVGQYMTQKRLAMARRFQLADSNLPIRVIAKMVGFGDQQHFNKFVRQHCKFVRQHCGMPPRQLREQTGYAAGRN